MNELSNINGTITADLPIATTSYVLELLSDNGISDESPARMEYIANQVIREAIEQMDVACIESAKKIVAGEFDRSIRTAVEKFKKQ